MGQEVLVDVREMPPRERHPRIFAAWETLPVGDAMRLVNDHDPKPLYYEFAAERSGEFQWTPVEQGPERWAILITRVKAGAAAVPGAAAPRPAWAAAGTAELDVRADLRAGKEPFARIMEAAAAVAPGGAFALRAIFEPKPLYALLAGKGFEAWTERLADDDWRVYFRLKARGGCGCGGHGH